MDFRQLRYFVTTAEVGSILRAANALHISQPALSKRLAELEDSLGTKLFERHARGVNLTVAGGEFFQRAQEILESVQRMREAVIAAGENKIRFQLGVTAAPTATLIPRLLERSVAQKLPIQFAIRQGSLEEIQHLLETGALDGAISFALPPVLRGLRASLHSGTPAQLKGSLRSVLADTCDELIAEGRLPWRHLTTA